MEQFINFIWICWFLLTLLLAFELILVYISLTIKNKPMINSKSLISNVIAMLYQLYFWLDYIEFWKEVFK